MNILQKTIYRLPDPPPRVRTKPMEVIAVGPHRSATESLSQALLDLGLDHTYHGWDILFEQPCRAHVWSRLAEKKWYGPPDGDVKITRAEFDECLGHSVAVTDAAASCFAAELIEAYPEAKVILNIRKDLDAWHKSIMATIAPLEPRYVSLRWFITWFSAEGFWMWHIYFRLLLPGFFRSNGRAVTPALEQHGKWVYREHCNMIRGLVPKENLLEWSVEDGWEPLCKFLKKDIPDTPFPRTNNITGFEARTDAVMKMVFKRFIVNFTLFTGITAGGGYYLWRWLARR